MTLKYEPVRNNPIARFYYSGHHTHPVRRTVLLIEAKRRYIRGYELREGAVVRPLAQAPIKTYRRDRIAPSSPYQRRNKKSARTLRGPLTLRRTPVLDLVIRGA